MPPPNRLTTAQRSHIKSLITLLGEDKVRIDGYDLANRPVIGRTDVNGYKAYAIRANGSGTDAQEPILQFRQGDLYVMPWADQETIEKLADVIADEFE